MSVPDNLSPTSPHPPPSAHCSRPQWVLGPRFIEHAQDFAAGFHTGAYLRWRLLMTGLDLEPPPTPVALEAMRAAGYTDWTKFSLHLPLWHKLARPMPRGYASFIGAREDTLLAAAEQDRADARRALELPSRPPVFGGKYFGPLKFPRECQNEVDRLTYTVAFSSERGPGTVFQVPGLKMYSVAPGGGSAWVTLYEFHVRLRHKDVEFVQEEQTRDVPIPEDARGFTLPS